MTNDGITGRLDDIDAAVRHGLTAITAIRKRIEFVRTIPILFGGIIKKTATTFKVFGIIFGSACVHIGAKKSLWHG
jgi:hypothetical protein